MPHKVTVSVYHDKRQVDKKNNKYPVKLRVYHSGIKKLYPLGYNLTAEEFNKSYLTKNPKGYIIINKETVLLSKIKNDILFIESKANRVIQEMDYFTFDKFNSRVFRESTSISNVFYYYEQAIIQLESEERIKTAKSYTNSMKSIRNHLKENGKKNLSFNAITSSFLNEYERWMLKKGNSMTTVGIYLRPLRALYNKAIIAGEVDKELYPFKKAQYLIPGGTKIKKILEMGDLKKLLQYSLPHGPLKKARDYWSFSFQCSGINIRDIAELKGKNLTDDSIIFIRTKTKRATKNKPKNIIVTLTDPVRQIIKEYGNTIYSKDDYVFPILNKSMDAKEKVRVVDAFTRFINQHIKSVAALVGVNKDISSYFARHQYVARAIQLGASKAYVQQQLGHESINTTENYFHGFEDSVRNEIDNKLMDF